MTDSTYCKSAIDTDMLGMVPMVIEQSGRGERADGLEGRQCGSAARGPLEQQAAARQRRRGRLQQDRGLRGHGVCSRHCSIRFISIW